MPEPIAINGFPRELLDAPVEARIKYFEDYHVVHPHLLTVYEQLRAILRQPAGVKIVKVIGLTGAGKTTLRVKTEKLLVEQILPDLERDPGRLPFSSLQVPGYERGFDWSDFYRRCLRQIEEPMLDEKVLVPRRAAGSFPIVETKLMAALRQSYEDALKARRPPAVVFDDAHRFARITGTHKLGEQQEVIQSLAESCPSLFVLFGTYN